MKTTHPFTPHQQPGDQPRHKFNPGRLAISLLAACAAALTAGCQSSAPVYSEVGPGGAPEVVSSPSTRLQEGDVIRIAFEVETNYNSTAKIQLDGAIVLPLIGEVKAAGLTLQELQNDLMQRYQKLVRMSDLKVTILSTSASIYVSGAVLRPGRIPLDRPLTALEAIMEAGGFDPTRAKPNKVSVIRMEEGKQKHYTVNLKKALEEGDTHPFQLKPFDIVHVPEKTFNF